MARAAGDSKSYRLRLMRGDTPDPDEGLDLLSVTTALGVISKAEALVPWAWREGIKGAAEFWKQPLPDPELTIDTSAAGVEAWLREQGKAPWQQMERGGTRGQGVHARFEEFVKQGASIDSLSEDGPDAGYYRALEAWWDTTKPDVVECERFVACYEGFWGGTLDYVRKATLKDMGRFADGYILGDLKTSKGAYPEHHLQVEAYRHAIKCSVGKRTVPGYDIVGTEITVLHADGTYEVVPGDGDFKGFLAALDLYRVMEQYAARHPRGRARK